MQCQHVDGFTALALGDLADQFEAVAADTEADVDVLVADRLGFLGDGIGERIIRLAGSPSEDAVDGPAEIDGGRPRLG